MGLHGLFLFHGVVDVAVEYSENLGGDTVGRAVDSSH